MGGCCLADLQEDDWFIEHRQISNHFSEFRLYHTHTVSITKLRHFYTHVSIAAFSCPWHWQTWPIVALFGLLARNFEQRLYWGSRKTPARKHHDKRRLDRSQSSLSHAVERANAENIVQTQSSEFNLHYAPPLRARIANFQIQELMSLDPCSIIKRHTRAARTAAEERSSKLLSIAFHPNKIMQKAVRNSL